MGGNFPKFPPNSTSHHFMGRKWLGQGVISENSRWNRDLNQLPQKGSRKKFIK
jgi:hypothetical protein